MSPTPSPLLPVLRLPALGERGTEGRGEVQADEGLPLPLLLLRCGLTDAGAGSSSKMEFPSTHSSKERGSTGSANVYTACARVSSSKAELLFPSLLRLLPRLRALS